MASVLKKRQNHIEASSEPVKNQVTERFPKRKVTNTVIPPPDDLQVPRGKWWCPYCGEVTKHSNDEYLGVIRADCCGISERDYYVRSYNGLWETYKGKRKGKSK